MHQRAPCFQVKKQQQLFTENNLAWDRELRQLRIWDPQMHAEIAHMEDYRSFKARCCPLEGMADIRSTT